MKSIVASLFAFVVPFFGMAASYQPKVTATLQTPVNVYSGETFTARLDFRNTRQSNPCSAPIFEVVSTGQIFTVSGNVYTNRVWLLGLSTVNPYASGKLEAEEAGSVEFSVTAGVSGQANWNVIFREEGQPGTDAEFPLDALFDPGWLQNHAAGDDALVSYLQTNIGTTWAQFYKKFATYLSSGTQPLYADFWKTAASFVQQVYYTYSGRTVASATPRFSSAVPAEPKLTASCSHPGSSYKIDDATSDSYDGTLWWLCPECGKWRLMVKGAFGNSPKYYEELAESGPIFVLIHDVGDKRLDNGKILPLAQVLQSKGMVLGVNWYYSAHRDSPYKGFRHVVQTIVRHLQLLDADPSRITLIGVGMGAHLAGCAITQYVYDPVSSLLTYTPFARLVALDPYTMDNGEVQEFNSASDDQYGPVIFETNWIHSISSARCTRTELYKSSWNRSLTKQSQLFADFNFAVRSNASLYPAAIGDESVRTYSLLTWFVSTVGDSEGYAGLGYNFAGTNTWTAWAAGDEAVGTPHSAQFAGVINGNRLELLAPLRSGLSPWRYAETMLDGGSVADDADAFSELLRKVAGVSEYSLADAALPASLNSGATFSVTVTNRADNLSVPFTDLPYFRNQSFCPWTRGLSAGAWLVNLPKLRSRVGTGTLNALLASADAGAELAQLLRELNDGSLICKIGRTTKSGFSNFILPQTSQMAAIQGKVRSDCFGTDEPLSSASELLLLVAAGIDADSSIPVPFGGELYEANGYAVRQVTVSPAAFYATVLIDGKEVVNGDEIVITAGEDGDWSKELNGPQQQDVDGVALTYTYTVTPTLSAANTGSVTPTSATGAILSGTLADGTKEERYAITVTVTNPNGGSDTMTFTAVVQRSLPMSDGVSLDTVATDVSGELTAFIEMLGPETPKITWEANLPNRIYTVQGKTKLTDPEWVSPTNSTHRFFRVIATPAPLTSR